MIIYYSIYNFPSTNFLLSLALILGLAVCSIRRKDTQKKMLQMFPDDDIRETIINYADGAGEENTVILPIYLFFPFYRLFFKIISLFFCYFIALIAFVRLFLADF